jgi:hypothetical protein
MLDWALSQNIARIVDPGCGTGRFAGGAARRDPTLAIIALDIDPLATLLTRAVLAVLGARAATVLHADYADPGAFKLEKISRRTAFVGNPPYVRHHDLSVSAKERAEAIARRFGLLYSGLAGLHAHFYLATAMYAQPGDVGCLVTSAEWLDVGYGAMIREVLMGPLQVQALHVIHPKAVPFEDAMVTAAIACFSVGERQERVRLRLVESPEDLGDLTQGRELAGQELMRAPRWTRLLAEESTGNAADATVPLRSVARVHRGMATGSNQFFVLPREQAAFLGLTEWCRPAITQAQEILQSDGVIRDCPTRRVLLDIPSDVEPAMYRALQAYLKQGEHRRNGRPAVAEGYLASHRRPWWRLGVGTPPPIVVSYMARQAPVFALNPDRLALLNIAHGIYPTRPLTDEQLAALVAYLNQTRETFRGRGRTYHGGLEKFEPRELEALPIPADGPWAE